MADSSTSSPQQTEDVQDGASQVPARGDGAANGAAAGPLMPPKEVEMSFLDHLEDLRWTIFKGLAGVVVMVIVALFFHNWIIREVLLGPTKPDFFMYGVLGLNAEEIFLLNRTITGQFFADIGTVVIVGLIAGSPILIYYLWRFIEPALYPHEREGMQFAAVLISFFLFLGIAFGYLILTPLALQFFQTYQISGQIVNQFDITKYFSMVTMWALGTGILFELPVVIYFLSKLGIVTSAMLRKYRKYALLIVLVLAAVVTPPDPISQVIVAIPLMLLYEMSIHIAAFTEKRRRRALQKQMGKAPGQDEG